ncbi:hypothetical protein ACLOJK_006309 [Asimina triloba]
MKLSRGARVGMPFRGKVDLVLMSDVFYDASEKPALAKTLKGLIGGETRIWLNCKAEADDDLEASVLDEAMFPLFLRTAPELSKLGV